MYQGKLAGDYWKKRIIEGESKINTVLSYSENEVVNFCYDRWEKEIISEFIGDIADKEVLDIPAGIGRWTEVLLSKEAKVTSIDICNDILDLLKNRFNNSGNLTCVASDVSVLKLIDNYYDVILCTGLYEHLPKDIYIELTKKFTKYLKKGGKLVLVINNANSKFLTQKSDNFYRKGEQLENGYYCSITNSDEVIETLVENDIDIKSFSLNPCYSIIRKIRKCALNEDEGTQMEYFKLACENDIEFFSNLDSYHSFDADQIIICGVKK